MQHLKWPVQPKDDHVDHNPFMNYMFKETNYGHLHLRFLFEEEFVGDGFARIPRQLCPECGTQLCGSGPTEH